MAKSDSLKVGDAVQLSGGYDFEPEWLAGTEHVDGSVIGFIPGQNETQAVVVRIERTLTYEGVSGDILVLELRYVGAVWGITGVVHIELCDFIPETKPWNDRRQGKWAESHATYKLKTD